MSTRRLKWPGAGDATVYRVNVRNEDTGERRTIYEGPELACALPADIAAAWGLATYRVEARPFAEGEGAYRTIVHYLAVDPLGPAEQVDDMLHGAEIEGAEAYRLLVVDAESGQRVTEYWSVRPRFRTPAILDAGRKHQYRLSYQQGGEVKHATRLRALPAERIAAARARADALAAAVAAAAPASQAPAATEKAEEAEEAVKVGVSGPRASRVKPGAAADVAAAGAAGAAGLALVAVDVTADLAHARLPDPEAAFDALVWGRGAGGPAVGLDFLLDRIAAARLRPTLFLDIFAEHVFGRAALERVLETAVRRGLDVQLLLRPSPNLRFAADPALAALGRATADLDAGRFGRVVAAAVELFEGRVGRAPVAVRLAMEGATDAAFPVLARHGLSVYAGAAATGMSPWLRARTRPCVGPARVVTTPPTRCLSLPAHPYDSALLSDLRIRMSPEVEETALRQAQAPVLLALSPQDLLFFRAMGEAAASGWNTAFASRYRVGDRVDAATPVVEGRDEIAIEALERVLRRLTSRRDLTPATFAELARDHLAACVRDPLGWDPIVEHHRGARRGRVTAVRRYSADYLAALEG
ncbi:hypothetical protein [Caulobacter sp. 17J80-11]|uniref:hypothetical protein n=1 Tax=Caulobacter sp. 17J80-11 TaxID=2763502 RepID=UPI0016539C6F|nr:hypothetical protein [Caulobacter sp. 17J80-11]MBC6981685.1 hypothetical protein [Caulobacter sp. 17J80-11]